MMSRCCPLVEPTHRCSERPGGAHGEPANDRSFKVALNSGNHVISRIPSVFVAAWSKVAMCIRSISWREHSIRQSANSLSTRTMRVSQSFDRGGGADVLAFDSAAGAIYVAGSRRSSPRDIANARSWRQPARRIGTSKVGALAGHTTSFFGTSPDIISLISDDSPAAAGSSR